MASSIFGPPNPATSSIFSNAANASTSQPKMAQTSNLFGNPTSSQPQQQSSLFPPLGSQTKPQESTNPFASLGSSQAQQTTAPSSLSQQTSSLFAPQQTTNTSQPFASSLFTSQGPQQSQSGQPQQQDGEQPQAPSKDSQPVYFHSLLEKGRKRTHGADGGPGFRDLPSLQLGLGDIARRARELGGVASHTQGVKEADTRAHYLLAASGVNPGTTRRDLNSFNTQTFTSSHVQQPADWDPDTHKYVEQLQQQSTLKMITEGVNRAQRNFDAFLEENVDINWDLQRKKIYEHFGLMSKSSNGTDDLASHPSQGEKGSFGRSSRRSRGAVLGRPGQGIANRSIFGASGMQKSVIGTPGVGSGNATLFADVAEKSGAGSAAPEERFVREKQGKYAIKVQLLNRARLQELPYPVIQEFASVEAEPGGGSPSQLMDAYKALNEIVDEKANPKGPEPTKERRFADDYLDETASSAKAMGNRKRILNGARRCLEKHFYDHLETMVNSNPREANLGGIPTTINKVRAYIRIRAARKDLGPDGVELQILDNDHCWALIFFLLRSGLVKEAAEYVTSNATSFRALDRNFITYITSFATNPERRLPRSMQERVNAEYQQRSRIAPENSLDPYRMACYKIIGRCELSKRIIEGMSQGVEDWIWLQFNLAREVNRVEEVAADVFGLEEIQDSIREIGDRHFSKGAEGMGGYGTYFFLQILGGMFEQAVAYLYSYSYVAAVHFAIALDYYGFLRVSDFSLSDTELLTYSTKQLPQISFGRMLGYYTRDFRSGNVEAAVDYLALICLNANLPGALGKSQSDLCHEALRELVLETREFAQLLGDINANGTRIKGFIEQRLMLISLADQEAFLKTVTIQAASVADDNGRTTDAVLLYHLAEDYDNVIIIINRALSEAIAVDIGQEQMRLQPLKPRTNPQQDQPQQQQQEQQQPAGSSFSLLAVEDPAVLAKNMISLYNTNALYYQKIRPATRDACGVLLRMSEAKARVTAGQWAEALDIIDTLGLLPLHARSSIPLIRSHAQAFNTLPSTISRNIGPLLLWTITCIGQQRDVLQSGGFEGETRREMGEELLTGAKDLMVFAGLVKYRLGEKVWEGLVRCGGDVGVY